MRHAYLIIAHNEPEVLATLLTLLDDIANDVFLHIDRRADAMRRRFEKWRMKKSALFLLEDPIEVCWGDISQVDVELRLFHAAHDVGGYDYYHLLSGCDLPLHSQKDIQSFFSANAGREFIHFWRSEKHLHDLRRKVTRYYLFTRHMKDKRTWAHKFTAPVRNIVLLLQKITGFRRRENWEFCKGSNWVSITDGFCEYLLEHAEAIRSRLLHTLCPDEIFLQTVLWNSPFRQRLYCEKDNIENSTLRLIDWQRGNPYVWQRGDFKELMGSSALFARKFSEDDSELLHNILEALRED